MSSESKPFTTRMRTTAIVLGKTFCVGVRNNGTWFATCGGEEFDGSTPDQAVESIIKWHLQYQATLVRQSEADREDAEKAVRGLTNV